MEDYFNREEQHQHLIIDEIGKSYLLDTARWGRFIGIVYTVAILLVCLFFPVVMISNPQYQELSHGAASFWFIFYIIVLLAIYFYPLYAIIKSASQARKAISQNDQLLLNDSFRLTKNLYKYLGVMTIVLICFYGLIIVFFMTAAITANAV